MECENNRVGHLMDGLTIKVQLGFSDFFGQFSYIGKDYDLVTLGSSLFFKYHATLFNQPFILPDKL